MRLNLTVIADYLKDVHVLQKKISHSQEMALRYVAFYKNQSSLHEDCLYLTNAEELPSNPAITTHCNLICTGYLPVAYLTDFCNFICVSADTDRELLFNMLVSIFDSFNRFEERMNQALFTSQPFDMLGDVIYDIFKNPIYVVDRNNRILFVRYNPDRPEFRDRYESHALLEYSLEDENEVLLSDTKFFETYQSHEAVYVDASLPIYGVSAVVCNIYEQDIYMGRILIDNTYRKPVDSDYPLLKWIADYIGKILKNENYYDVHTSKKLEGMIKSLLIDHCAYRKEYDAILRRQNWKRNDNYLCVYIVFSDCSYKKYLGQDAQVLKSLFNDQSILLVEDAIIQVINISKEKLSMEKILKKMKNFIIKKPLTIGVSVMFSDFQNIWLYYQQAHISATYKLRDSCEQINIFENHILDIFVKNAIAEFPEDFYLNTGLRNLIQYDYDNNSDYVRTLKCYLECNQSATKTQELLHIARTTCLYRIQRIKEITGLDLSDPDMLLYLKIMFYMQSLNEI